MRKIPNLAVIGKMRSGKDELAIILEELGYQVKRLAFGDSMKEMYHLANPDVPRSPKPIAEYIKFGQSEREKDSEVFVRPTLSKLWFEQALDRGHDRARVYIFTDVRQPNEYDAAVNQAGFIPVRIYASEETRIARMIANGETVSQEILNAPTERYLERFPVEYTISNDGTRDEFKQEIIELIRKLTTKEE
ncbi:hypothetical protein [Bacillus anthracis]